MTVCDSCILLLSVGMASVWQAVYIGCVSISFFLFIMMISKPKKNTADKILGTWLFFALFDLTLIGWYAMGWIYETPELFGWELPFPFLHGPFLYLYILFLSGQRQRRWHNLEILHFAPAVLVVIVLAFVLPFAIVRIDGNYSVLPEYEPLFRIIVAGIIISGIVYIALSYRLLHRHKRNIERQFSNTGKITLNWMRYLISGMSVIWMVVIFDQAPFALFMTVALFIFFLGYFGIRQVGIFSNPQPLHEVFLPRMLEKDVGEEKIEKDVFVKMKYEKNRLEEEEACRIQCELAKLMQEKECYRDPELTLGDLATMLNVHPALLSQVINSKEAKTFYDYVNTLRIEAFKKILQEPENSQYTLLSLAFECGFNSKTSFNRNFKKIVQMSPTDYMKRHKKEIEHAD